MSKYIITNCDLFNSFSKECLKDNGLCEFCTDCVIKQIVELCKEDLKPVREWKEGNTVFIEYKKDVHLARNILQLLDIQGVE